MAGIAIPATAWADADRVAPTDMRGTALPVPPVHPNLTDL